MRRIRQARIKRKFVLMCLGMVGFVSLLYGAVAYSILDDIRTVQLVSCSQDRFAGGGNATRKPHGNIEARKVLKELAGFSDIGIDALQNNSVINTVHFVWCGNKTYEFVHYLSVLSAWKMLQPDIIEFHVEYAPMVDKYNTWIDEIQKTIPAFVIRQIPKYWDGSERGCGFAFGLAVLEDRGGIYIRENVILGQQVYNHRGRDVSLFYTERDNGVFDISMAMAKDHVQGFRDFRVKFGGNVKDFTKPHFCQTLDKQFVINSSSDCFVLQSPLQPKDIFQLETNFGDFVRQLVYGNESIKVQQSFLPGTIPKIVHYVWFGEKEMDFMMYLSMLSTLFILNPERVIVYTDGYLHGHYVERIKRDKRVMFVAREKPTTIFGKPVLYSQHRSDIVRAEVLLKYGGIYVDWDVLWLRDPSDIIQVGYDVVVNVDHMAHGPFPETLNLGVLMAKPKSTFIKRWQDALFDYRSKDFLYNAVQLPYKIYERFPEHVHIERRLQVMCFHLKCHPTFHPEYRVFTKEQPFDWRTDVYSIHFTYPDPPELSSEESCKNSTGRFAEIGQFILKNSHKLD